MSPVSTISNATGHAAIALETKAITALTAAGKRGPKAIITSVITKPQPAI